MRLWIKASLITFAIAIVILFFQYMGFLNHIYEGDFVPNTSELNNPTPEPEKVNLLKDSLFISTSPENYSNFALRLSNIYFSSGNYDSAARYKELNANHFPNEENWKSAGLMYYKAFENASGEEEEEAMARKAIECLENALKPTSSTEVKIALATLYFSYDNSKGAIVLLEEVLTIDAANKNALYMLGVHTFQLTRYKEASDYLNQLVEIDRKNINGLYFLAICQLKLGNTKEAKVLFEKLKLLDLPADVKADVDDYLTDIK